ncbi:MAG: HAMP domain-containing protein [Labilithrix sp.]|nr:HAMP domain-containing protein [Labilithrix sp.]MBX3225015.1 HAMP domain-containing protein [Labilithrix sp.]
MSARASIPPGVKPSKTLATRILVSFAVTLVAFAVTVGFTVAAQKRAAEDSEELTNGFVPVALKLGRLRAVQSTLASIVDGIPDEKSPQSTRDILRTLDGERRLMFEETRAAMQNELRSLGSDETRQLALVLTGELDAAAAEWAGDRELRDRVFAALDDGDRDVINRDLLALGAMEHAADKRLRALADHVDTSMKNLSAAARAREQRAVVELALLAALTLAVGVGVSIHTRRLLGPLERVTQRAKAVARGDLTPQPTERTDDEIGELATAFERMVASVAKAQNRAVANERLAAIGKMAAHVTHEIRNPLSSIGLNIELLEENLAEAGTSGEPLTLLQAITREVQRLEHLSEEYLRVARLPQPRMESEDLAAKVREIVAFAKPEMDRAGLGLELDVEDDIPLVLFDEGQIRQAILNVLRNAREAMTDGGTIRVYVRAEGMSVVVGVDDEGGGIPEDVRSRIFDPFFSTKGEGTGLGLAITRQIVEAHGGSIAVEPREDKGTTFRLLLPIAPARNSGPHSLPPSRASRAL